MAAVPPLKVVDPDDAPVSTRTPGCGLGLYVLLLLVLFLMGLAGMAFSTWNLIGSAGDRDPRALMSGSDVQSWRLLPMREAGLLGATELPAAWHDESEDFMGATACALTADAVLRVEPGSARRLAFDDMASVEIVAGASGEVVLMEAKAGEGEGEGGSTGVGCRFRKGEGGNRFLRMVQVELLKRERGVR